MSARLPLADIQFIAEFAAFCRTKGDKEYLAADPYSCALAQFGHPGITDENCRAHGVPYSALFAAASHGSHTFPLLARRLEALIADAPVVERGQ